MTRAWLHSGYRVSPPATAARRVHPLAPPGEFARLFDLVEEVLERAEVIGGPPRP